MILDENLFDENINVIDGTKINEEKIADKIRANQDPKEMTKRALNILKDIGGNYIDIAKEYETTYGESPFDGPIEESLNEDIEYIKWVQMPNGKWKIWGSNNGPELDPDFLDRARKQNNTEYKDAKVSKNGEYPIGVSEEDIEETHRFESLEEAVDEEPWTKEEIEKELKSITKNFTKKEGTVRVWMSSEKNDARDILKQNYKYVDVSDGKGSSKEEMSWVIAYSDPKDEKEEN